MEPDLLNIPSEKFIQEALKGKLPLEIWHQRLYKDFGEKSQFPKSAYIRAYSKIYENAGVHIYFSFFTDPNYLALKTMLYNINKEIQKWGKNKELIGRKAKINDQIEQAKDLHIQAARDKFLEATDILKQFNLSREYRVMRFEGTREEYEKIKNNEEYELYIPENFDLIFFFNTTSNHYTIMLYLTKFINIPTTDVESEIIKWFKIFLPQVTLNDLLKFYGLKSFSIWI